MAASVRPARRDRTHKLTPKEEEEERTPREEIRKVVPLARFLRRAQFGAVARSPLRAVRGRSFLAVPFLSLHVARRRASSDHVLPRVPPRPPALTRTKITVPNAGGVTLTSLATCLLLLSRLQQREGAEAGEGGQPSSSYTHAHTNELTLTHTHTLPRTHVRTHARTDTARHTHTDPRPGRYSGETLAFPDLQLAAPDVGFPVVRRRTSVSDRTLDGPPPLPPVGAFVCDRTNRTELCDRSDLFHLTIRSKVSERNRSRVQ